MIVFRVTWGVMIGAAMELTQWFETVIDNADLPQDVGGFRFVFVPSLRDSGEFPSAGEVAHELELEYLADIASATTLPSVLAAVLLGRDAAAAVDVPWQANDVEREIALFVENVAFSRLIPVQSSPLDLQSLASVLTTGSGVAIGAWAGVVASGGTPLILITVPVGMIIGGAAAGVGRALEAGLEEKLRTWIRRRRRSWKPRGVHVRQIRLAGNRERNGRLLTALKSIPGVEEQTRFVEEESPEVTVIQVFSAEPIADDKLRRLAQDTGAEILSITDDIVL
jgi:hypothetical protein